MSRPLRASGAGHILDVVHADRLAPARRDRALFAMGLIARHPHGRAAVQHAVVRTLAAAGEGPARALVGRTRSEGMKLTGAVVCRSR